MNKSHLDCYNPKACCNSDCYAFELYYNEPCWGDVDVVAEECTENYEDCWWIHACQGHIDTYDGGKYKPKVES